MKKDPITLKINFLLKGLSSYPLESHIEKCKLARRILVKVYNDYELCKVVNLRDRLILLENEEKLKNDNTFNIATGIVSGLFTYILTEVSKGLDLSLFISSWFIALLIGMAIYFIASYIAGIQMKNLKKQDVYLTREFEIAMIREKIEFAANICANKQAHPQAADGLDKCTNQII